MRTTERQQHTVEAIRADRARPVRTFVLVDRWSWTDAAVAVLGVVLALAGLGALLGAQIGNNWAWIVAVAGWGLVVSVVAFAPPRRGRVERVVETH